MSEPTRTDGMGATIQADVAAYARHDDQAFVAVGARIARIELRTGESDRSVDLPGDVSSLAASAGGVVAAVGNSLSVLDLDLTVLRTLDLPGPVLTVVAGPSAAWARWSAREIEVKGKGMLGQPMAMVMASSVTRLGLSDVAVDQTFSLGQDWLVLQPNQPAGMRLDLADLEGNEAVALVCDVEDLFVVRRPLQRIVRVPSIGQPITETRTSAPFVSQLVLSDARHFWATEAGLNIDQSPVLQMAAGSGEWIPTRHGMFGVWAAVGDQVTVFKLGADGTLETLLRLPGSVPATGLGRDAIIEDDSGLWLTLKGAGATRFLRLDPAGRTVQTLEQPGAAYPVGVVGTRFYSVDEPPPTAGDSPLSKAGAALAWRAL